MIDYDLMEEKLRNDYKEVFQKAKLYCYVKNIDEGVMDDMLMNLFDLLLTAQDNEKTVQSVIGQDVEKFCEEYFQDYNLKERIRHLPKSVCRIMKWILFCEMIELFFIEDKGVTVFQAKSNLFPYLLGVLAGYIGIVLIWSLMRPVMFKSKKIKVYYAGMILLVIAVCIAAIIFSNQYEISVPAYITILFSFGYIVIYYIVRAIWRYKKYGTVHKQKEIRSDYEIHSLKDAISIDIEISLPKELVKRYEKINKRLVKRGKQELTPEQFMDKIRKEDAAIPKIWRVMKYFFLVIVLVCVIASHFAGENGIIGTIIFAVMLTLCETFIYKLCKKAAYAGMNQKEKVLDECERLGVNIVEYVKDEKKSL